jgi:uridylate kinase
MIKYNRVLLKVSGESLAGDKRFGISEDSLMVLAKQIKSIVSLGVQVGVVVGGGNFWRGRQSVDMDRGSSDYVGMLATVMNCIAVGDALNKVGVENKLISALKIDKVAKTYSIPEVLTFLEQGKVVLFAAGTGLPYFSTDTTASLRACEIHADAVLCAKNIDGVYDSDPKINPNAVKFDSLTYADVLEKDLKALDQTAIAMCREYSLPIVVFQNCDNAILDVVCGKNVGTIIK